MSALGVLCCFALLFVGPFLRIVSFLLLLAFIMYIKQYNNMNRYVYNSISSLNTHSLSSHLFPPLPPGMKCRCLLRTQCHLYFLLFLGGLEHNTIQSTQCRIHYHTKEASQCNTGLQCHTHNTHTHTTHTQPTHTPTHPPTHTTHTLYLHIKCCNVHTYSR